MIKKQNLFWGVLFLVLDAIAIIVEVVKKEVRAEGDIVFIGYVCACIVFGVVGIVYTVLGIIGFFKNKPDIRKKESDTKNMCVVAMLCAVAYVLTYVKLPVSFLSLEIKDSVIVLCTLIFGPMAGLKIAILVPFLEMLTHSATGIYGLIMNILSSMTFCLVTGLIYKHKRSFYGAIVALLAGIFSVTSVMVLANLLITPLYYTYFKGQPTTMVDVIKMIPALLLPFNFVKATLNGAIVLLLYKPLSNVLKTTKMINYELTDSKEQKFNRRSLIVTIVALVIIAVALCIIFFVLK